MARSRAAACSRPAVPDADRLHAADAAFLGGTGGGTGGGTDSGTDSGTGGGRRNGTGITACVTVTVVDGLVLARSVFEQAVNYRSAMIYGPVREVTEPAAKLAALRCLSEHLAPGQWDYVRKPSRKELAATSLLSLSLAEASVKIRRGPPDDADGPDAGLGLWAGELPLVATWQQPVPDPALSGAVPVPPHIARRAGTPASPL